MDRVQVRTDVNEQRAGAVLWRTIAWRITRSSLISARGATM